MRVRRENPIIPGFYPDPSICRVGEDYYLVTSSFEYFPGVPLFHSRDLCCFRQIGHVLTRESQLPLRGSASSKGIFAPTIRYHAGTYYVITTNMTHGGTFYVTAEHPRGPWSEPVWLNEATFGMDPSLCFADDGMVYFTRHGEGERGGIFQARLDVARGRLLEEPRLIWRGTGGVWPEGPHLYEVDGCYYLFIAEGGTSYGHMVTVARSQSPWGPFEPAPHNPILTHRHLEHAPVQALGHSDLVQAADGSWWLVFLGVRPATPGHHHLGRETFLAPVGWRDGWPLVNDGNPVESSGSIERSGVAPARDDFDSAELPLHYCFVRNPDPTSWSLTQRPGWMRLWGSSNSLDELASPTFVGRRQQHFDLTISCRLEFSPADGVHEAGLVLRANEDNHYDLIVRQQRGSRLLLLRVRIDGNTSVVSERELAAGALSLRIVTSKDKYEFFCALDDGPEIAFGEAETAALSSERAGGFTGVVVGMYARSEQGEPAAADFSYLELAPG